MPKKTYNAYSRIKSALENILDIDFSAPTSLEVELDSLASALCTLPEFKQIEELDSHDSLAEVLEVLIKKGHIDKKALRQLRAIESILEQIDYDTFEEDGPDELESAVHELHGTIFKMLKKVANNEFSGDEP